MTAEHRLERQLPAILADLYLGPSPDYRDEVLATALRTRQRPAWTFPGRWLPMADIASSPAFAPRVPWRSLEALLVIAVLLALIAYAVVGSQRTRLPAPFGPARNGVITFALDGDIYAGDPLRGAPKAVVTGDDLDRNPVFSRDGTRIAFFRQVPDQPGQFHLALVGVDSGSITILADKPIPMPDAVEWSPDGRSIIVNTQDLRLLRYDASGQTPPIVLAEGVHVQPGAFRPPDGAQILYQPEGISGTALWLMNADGTGRHVLLERPPEHVAGAILGSVRWSPDGRSIAFSVAPADDPDQARTAVLDVDDGEVRQLDTERGVWVDNDPAWSPDSTRIAFNHWEQTDPASDGWTVRPIGVVPAAGGPVRSVGRAPAAEGAVFDWSPDGSAILSLPGSVVEGYTWGRSAPGTVVRPDVIDVTSGRSNLLDWSVGSVAAWQRLAP
jgi:Tol biopolymer transport system component